MSNSTDEHDKALLLEFIKWWKGYRAEFCMCPISDDAAALYVALDDRDKKLLLAFCDWLREGPGCPSGVNGYIDAFLAARQTHGEPMDPREPIDSQLSRPFPSLPTPPAPDDLVLMCEKCGKAFPSQVVNGEHICWRCADAASPAPEHRGHPSDCPACNPTPSAPPSEARQLADCIGVTVPRVNAPCPECRDRPGHIAINGQEVACKTCGRTYAPPAPQRFWRVVEASEGSAHQGEFQAVEGPLRQALGPWRPTRAEAEADGIASGLPPWPGAKALP